MESKSGPIKEVLDESGKIKSYYITISGNEFIFDDESLKYFMEKFDDGNCLVVDGFLAKRTEGKILYFHREFKFATNPGVGSANVVQHKNGIRKDNRDSNLPFIIQKLHMVLPKEANQLRVEKLKARNINRNNFTRKRDDDRIDRIREKVRKRLLKRRRPKK